MTKPVEARSSKKWTHRVTACKSDAAKRYRESRLDIMAARLERGEPLFQNGDPTPDVEYNTEEEEEEDDMP